MARSGTDKEARWPTFRLARDLAGKVFPVSEAVILQTARKHGMGARWAASSSLVRMTVKNCTRFFHAP